MGEVNIYGVYVPILIIQAMLAYAILRLLNLLTDRLVEQGWIAMPSIFNLCLFVVLLWLVHWGFTLYLG